MCGISGIVDVRGRRQIRQDLLIEMNESIVHRGPDGSGFHFEPGVGFGHRRLSIIDLDGGKQPLYNEDETVVVTYNGEIYNFRELAHELEASGHRFRTRCDTEVIVHAWEEWGTASVDRFNGMFAFALWDRNREALFLARDRLGVKPLYYTVTDEGELVFGSELKAVLAHPNVRRDIDLEAVEEYFCFGYIPDPKTIYKHVRKLPPAHYLEAVRGRALKDPVRYWDVPAEPREDSITTSGNGAVEAELRERLLEAVKLRLVSDVPLGAFLSGGIDSSAVVAMMRAAREDRLLTCSIGFKEAQYDESHYAALVANRLSTDHKVEIVDSYDHDLLDDLVGIYDEPFADSSAIPTYRVCELARRHVTVALSGDGGDESFLGYRRYKLFAREEMLRSALPLWLRQPVFGTLGRVYPKLDWAPRVFRGKTTFQALACDSAEAYRVSVSILRDELRQCLFSADMRRELGGYTAAEVFRRHLEGRSFSDPLSLVQYLDYQTYLPGDILTKVDRASMAHSLEVRGPFLDYRLVEWAARLPTRFKLRGGEGKHVLKRALEPVLPREVLYREKMGFAVPIDIWFRTSLTRRVAESVEGSTLAQCGLFDTAFLRRIFDEHRDGRRNHAPVLWALMMFEGFLRRHERPVVAPSSKVASVTAEGGRPL